jgi:hypothetical protein
MSEQWDYQVRIDLADELAETTRRDPGNPALPTENDAWIMRRAPLR